MRKVLLFAFLGGLWSHVAAELAWAQVEVKIRLPVRARLDLEGRQTLAVAPFLVIGREGTRETRVGSDRVDVRREFERYLLKVLRRETRLKVLETGPVDYPVYDLQPLLGSRDFWRTLGERLGVDLIVTGSLDFEIQDKSGYRTEEYVSPFDGRTYYRQVLVERTGFEYDIVLAVIDARSGERIHFDNFKDFKQFEEQKADALQGMFENLAALEDRILSVFVEKSIEATRTLLLPR